MVDAANSILDYTTHLMIFITIVNYDGEIWNWFFTIIKSYKLILKLTHNG